MSTAFHAAGDRTSGAPGQTPPALQNASQDGPDGGRILQAATISAFFCGLAVFLPADSLGTGAPQQSASLSTLMLLQAAALAGMAAGVQIRAVLSARFDLRVTWLMSAALISFGLLSAALSSALSDPNFAFIGRLCSRIVTGAGIAGTLGAAAHCVRQTSPTLGLWTSMRRLNTGFLAGIAVFFVWSGLAATDFFFVGTGTQYLLFAAVAGFFVRIRIGGAAVNLPPCLPSAIPEPCSEAHHCELAAYCSHHLHQSELAAERDSAPPPSDCSGPQGDTEECCGGNKRTNVSRAWTLTAGSTGTILLWCVVPAALLRLASYADQFPATTVFSFCVSAVGCILAFLLLHGASPRMGYAAVTLPFCFSALLCCGLMYRLQHPPSEMWLLLPGLTASVTAMWFGLVSVMSEAAVSPTEHIARTSAAFGAASVAALGLNVWTAVYPHSFLPAAAALLTAVALVCLRYSQALISNIAEDHRIGEAPATEADLESR